MRGLVIGGGEIGHSILYVLQGNYDTKVYDINFDKQDTDYIFDTHKERPFEILHICFPYSKDFVKQVKDYQKHFKPKYTVIHSTVPIGTSKKCNAVHSPVVGIHPHLQESIKTFTKFLGGKQAGEIADYFRRAGIKVYVTDKSETTELMKIQCTTYYAMMIEFTKDMKEQCNKYGVPFEAWTVWNDNYSQGYEKLGYPEYHRPNLVPIMKKQGGHCTLNNLKLLKTKFTTFLNKIK
jgi:hypothetical protein